MKHGQLIAIGHNLADSLASGLCLIVGCFQTDIYGEAAQSDTGAVTVDFLAGSVIEGNPSPPILEVVALLRKVLPDFCARNGAKLDDFQELLARFSVLKSGVAKGFTVTVKDVAGRNSVTEYLGNPGARPRILDELGRVRRAPIRIVRT